MPTPKTDEKRSAFISRCVPFVMKEGDIKSSAHAVAKCHGIWKQSKKRSRRVVNQDVEGRQLRRQIARSNPLRLDPTRTATLRRLFATEMARRFNALKRAIRQLIVVEDAFGLKRKHQFKPLGNVAINTRWAFMTDPQKLDEFHDWLTDQINGGILEATGQRIPDQPWTAEYIKRAYNKGHKRAFDDVRHPELSEQLDFMEGTREEFLRSSFDQPESIAKIRILAGRTFTELKGVSEITAQQLRRILADGLIAGINPNDIARQIARQIDAIGIHRARLIARTEIIRAHAEGQLDALEKLGVIEVGVMVEWDTAGDDRVCPLCEEMGGVVLKIDEARGLIPRHPLCRCAFIPANVGEDPRGQKRGRGSIRKAISRSLTAEIPKRSKRTLAKQRESSRWLGADVKIAKKRPRSVLE